MSTENESSLETKISSKIVSAYVSNNTVPVDQLQNLYTSVFECITSLSKRQNGHSIVNAKPAVPINQSMHNDYIICLEDGKKFKSLKRHLNTSYGLSPEEYRRKWGLQPDYPMVAPSYSKRRSQLARELKLGREPGTKITQKGK